MAPRWEPSSDTHGVPRADQIYAILHATYMADLGPIFHAMLLGPKVRRYREEHPNG